MLPWLKQHLELSNKYCTTYSILQLDWKRTSFKTFIDISAHSKRKTRISIQLILKTHFFTKAHILTPLETTCTLDSDSQLIQADMNFQRNPRQKKDQNSNHALSFTRIPRVPTCSLSYSIKFRTRRRLTDLCGRSKSERGSWCTDKMTS